MLIIDQEFEKINNFLQLREEIAKCLIELNIGVFKWRRDAIHNCASFVSGVISHLLSRYELIRLDSGVQYNNLRIFVRNS